MEKTAQAVFMNLNEIKRQTGWGASRIYEFASRAVDPLPLRYVDGTKNGGVALVDELEEWFKRNSVSFTERG